MTFVLRKSTRMIKDKLYYSYHRNSKIALLTVKTGGGKTYGAIHTFGSMMPNCTLLVFTTAKVAKSKQWEKSVKDYNQVMHTDLTILCFNYEKLTSKRFLSFLKKRLAILQNSKMQIVLVLDEVHRIKLSSSGKLSKRARLILNLAKQPYIVTTLGLSATAFSNSYLDVAPYLIIAGYYRSVNDFMVKHIKRKDKFHQPVVTDYTGKLSRNAFINPDQIDYELKQITNYIDTSMYKPFCQTRYLRFKLNHDERQRYDQILRAYQNKEYEYLIQARMDEEMLLATDLATSKDVFLLSLFNQQEHNTFDQVAPVLIFYQYTSVYVHLRNLLMSAFPSRPIVTVNGKVKIDDQMLVKPPSKDAIYLVQYEAGGEGLDWQWSNLSVFYESPVRYEKFVQAQGRNLRNKSEMSKVYHFELEFINTIDSQRWSTNREKRDFTDEISKRTFLQKARKVKL